MLFASLDTETSGLIPRDTPKGDHSWPFIVQVGCELFTLDGVVRSSFCDTIRPDGRRISSGATAVHGISSQQADREGMSELCAMAVLAQYTARAKAVICYNSPFDIQVIESSLMLMGKDTRMVIRPGLVVIDIIQPCAQLCKIPTEHPSNTHRYPKLDVACETILGEKPREGAHNALKDAERVRRLFLYLWEKDMIPEKKLLEPQA